MSQRRTIEGPDGYWSTDLPVSRGQWKDLAMLGCRLLGIPVPKNRLEATTAMVRLRTAVDELPEREVPPPW